MKAISRALDRFCYNHPRLGIPQLMKYIALGNVAVFIADMLMNGLVSYWIAFIPELILRGQIWRLVTFVFVPVSSGGTRSLDRRFSSPWPPSSTTGSALPWSGSGGPPGSPCSTAWGSS